LLANEGITDELRLAFLIYLISHKRPVSEILSANRKDITQEYQRGFAGMTEEAVPLDELLKARETLVAEVVGRMPDKHREFLIGFEAGQPDWSLLELEGAEALPAVKWRQQNLDSLTKDKRAALVKELQRVLEK
jgi:hypothetical protein